MPDNIKNIGYGIAYQAKKNADAEQKEIMKTAGRDPEQEEIWRRHSSPS